MSQDICIFDFLKKIEIIIKAEKKIIPKKRDYYYWDKANSAKEKYRESTKFGVSGSEKVVSIKETAEFLKLYLAKIETAVKKSYIKSKKTYATYFINEIKDFRKLNKNDVIKNMPLVWPTSFKSRQMPLFLEGAVRSFKVEKDINKKQGFHKFGKIINKWLVFRNLIFFTYPVIIIKYILHDPCMVR